jgi:ABC-type nitrate/sulfonate/bicarbonate transport system substrate-binding protein
MTQHLTRSTFLSAVAAGAVALAVPRIAFAQATPVRLAGVFSDLFAEPFYAKAAGAFAKLGFDTSATSLNNAGAVAAALGGGALEMGTGDLVSGVNAIIAGVPVVLIAGGGLYQESLAGQQILAVANESPIHSPKDIIGKTIGVPTLVGLTTACLRAWLPDHGIPNDSVHLVEIPQSSVVPALQRGTLDLALLGEPFLTFSRGQVRSVGNPMNAAADHAPGKAFPVSVWYASKGWFEADQDRARRAVQAIYDTARWANTHHDETLDILVRDGHLDASKLGGMSRTVYATSLEPAQIQPVFDIAERFKLFPKPVDAQTVIAKV